MLDTIKKISMQVIDELSDAKKYIKCADKYKESNPELADLYYHLSEEELDHATRLHEQGTSMIMKGEEEDTEVSEIVWDWETERNLPFMKDIMVMQEMFSK